MHTVHCHNWQSSRSSGIMYVYPHSSVLYLASIYPVLTAAPPLLIHWNLVITKSNLSIFNGFSVELIGRNADSSTFICLWHELKCKVWSQSWVPVSPKFSHLVPKIRFVGRLGYAQFPSVPLFSLDTGLPSQDGISSEGCVSIIWHNQACHQDDTSFY